MCIVYSDPRKQGKYKYDNAKFDCEEKNEK